jgi:hypothetical protein
MTLAALATVAAITIRALAPVQDVGKNTGELYPDLELPTIDRARTMRLSDLRGKRVLLVEFASW